MFSSSMQPSSSSLSSSLSLFVVQQELQPPPELPPVPSIQSLCLLSALSNPETNYAVHIAAINARDEALSCSQDSYNILCIQLLYVLVGCDVPYERIVSRLSLLEIEQIWKVQDPVSVNRLFEYITKQRERERERERQLQQHQHQHQHPHDIPNPWIPFGQMAGLVLKNALLRPPEISVSQQQQQQQQNQNQPLGQYQRHYYIEKRNADHMKEVLLMFGVTCRNKELRDVASTIISTVSVSSPSPSSSLPAPIQPELYLRSWPNLVPKLLSTLQQYQHQYEQNLQQSQHQNQQYQLHLQQQQNHHNNELYNNNNNNNSNTTNISTTPMTTSLSNGTCADAAAGGTGVGNVPVRMGTPPVVSIEAVEGCLSTLLKMMEDGPHIFTVEELDRIMSVVLGFLSTNYYYTNTTNTTTFHNSNTTNNSIDVTTTSLVSTNEIIIASLQIICACLVAGIMPNSLVLHFHQYLHALSALGAATKSSSSSSSSSSSATSGNSIYNNLTNIYKIRKWVCRSIVTLLELRTEYIQPHIHSIGQYMLETTNILHEQQQAIYIPKATITATTTTHTAAGTAPPTAMGDMIVGGGLTNQYIDIMEQVALEACDFWFTFATLDETIVSGTEMMDQIATFLPQLVPILVRNMIYSKEKQYQFHHQQQQQQQQQQQNAQNIGNNNSMKPIFHKSKASLGGRRNSTSISNNSTSRDKNSIDEVRDDEEGGFNMETSKKVDHDEEDDNEYDDDIDDDDDDDDDNNGDGGTNEWTLRKCSAASLESLATLYGGEVIVPCLLPSLQEGLMNIDPWIQEASILALGAVADGCYEVLISQNHMVQIYPYLLQILASATPPPAVVAAATAGAINGNTTYLPPQVKSIAAWTVGQYSTWAVEQVQNGIQGQLLATMTDIFVRCINTESDRKVQVSCCAAFGTVIEAAGDLMAPYLEHIYKSIVSGALQWYTGRSLLVLFDLFGIIADCCGPAIAEQNLPSIYVPPLLHIWDTFAKVDPSDRRLLPLMECLASIAVTCGMNYQPYALESFEYAMFIIEQVSLPLVAPSKLASGHHHDVQLQCKVAITTTNEEDYDPIICATDLLDGLVEGLGSNFTTLLSCSGQYGSQFLNALLSLCRHEISGIRMSALALFGDLARNAPIVLESILPQLLTEAIDSMDPINPSVAVNAVWAVGEVCVKCEGNPEILEPFAQSIVQNLIGILVGNGVVGHSEGGSDIPGLVENASACVGRLAKVNPNFVAPDVSRFLLGWCDGMGKIRDPIERRDAFQGFVQVLYANPHSIETAAVHTSDAIASILFAILTWHIPLDDDDIHAPKNEMTLIGDYNFQPFPATEPELGAALTKLVHEMKRSVGDEKWYAVEKKLPVNVRRLLREAYHL